MKFYKGTITAKTGATGNVSYAASGALAGLTFTPEAILFVGTNQTVEGYLGNVRLFAGAGTRKGGATQQWAQCISADDTLGTSDTARGNNNAACIHAHNDATTPTVEMVATLVSFDAGGDPGFTLNWSDTAGSAWIIHVFIWGGFVDGADGAYAGNILTTATTSNQSTTAPGFTPKALLGVANLQGAWNQDIAQANITMGVATGPTERACMSWRSRDARANEDLVSSQVSTKWLRGISSTAASDAFVIDVVSMDANGFTYADSVGGAAGVIGYLAFKDGPHKVGVETAKTSTGTKATTGIGFPPIGLVVGSWGLAASASIDSSSDANFAIGATDGVRQGYVGISADDGNTTMAVDSRTITTKLIGTQSVTPATLREAEIDSLDSDGYTLDQTTADGVASQHWHWAFGAGVITATVAQVTETDTAQPIGKKKARAAGQVSEADTAQALTTRKARAAGQVTETDSARPIARNPQRRLVGQVSETDTAQPITARKRRELGQVTETDTARPVTQSPLRRLASQVTETDTAQPVGRAKRRAVGQVAEADTAQPVTQNPLRRLVGRVTETCTAGAITPRRTRAIGQVTDTSTARPVTVAKRREVGQVSTTASALPVSEPGALVVAVGQVTTTDTAQPVGKRKVKSIGQASTADTAQPAARAKVRAVGQVVETDTAQQARAARVHPVGQAVETDASQAVGKAKRKAIGQAAETDTAQPAGRVRSRTIGQASETAAGQPVGRVKRRAIGQASTSDLAQLVTPRLAGVISQAVETDSAQPVGRAKRKAVGQATAADQAAGFTVIRTRSLGQATEADAGGQLLILKRLGISQALEAAAAQAVTAVHRATVGRVVETDTAIAVLLSGIQIPADLDATLAAGDDTRGGAFALAGVGAAVTPAGSLRGAAAAPAVMAGGVVER